MSTYYPVATLASAARHPTRAVLLRHRPCAAIGSVWMGQGARAALVLRFHSHHASHSHGVDKGDSERPSCWSCGACINTFNLFCGKCEYIQPLDDGVNFFELLQMPQAFDIDLGQLERNFKRVQRAIHPDLFGQKTKREQEMSADASSQVNTAYRVLRAPGTRAQYLLQLHGIDAIGESSGASFTDPELLMEIMEARECLLDPASPRESILALDRNTLRYLTRTVDDLKKAFASRDLERAAQLTVALQYYTKLKNEVDDWLELQRGPAAAREQAASAGAAATNACGGMR